MSKYAVYRLFNGCEAPGNISTFGGHLAGALVGTSDKNPLSRQHDGVHEHVPHELAPLRKTASGRVYCSCCGRELKRDYMYSPSWRFCPRCGAEVLR